MRIAYYLLIYFFVLISFGFAQDEKLKNETLERKCGYINIDDSKLYYELTEHGDCIVLIHGNFGDSRYWEYQIPAFAVSHQILSYDIRKYGKSVSSNDKIFYRNEDDLALILNELNISKANIIGFSMGSAIAIDFALKFPWLCKSLVLVGPWINGYNSDSTKKFKSDYLNIYSEMIANGNCAASDYAMKNTFIAETIKNAKTFNFINELLSDFDWQSYFSNRYLQASRNISIIGNIEVPTLIVTSDYDLESCKEIGNFINQRINGSKLFKINDAGHFAMIDKSNEFNEIVLSFIKSNN